MFVEGAGGACAMAQRHNGQSKTDPVKTMGHFIFRLNQSLKP